MLYMMFFYTDIFGIPAGFVGATMFYRRALDAISSDPCMGLLADRTRLAKANSDPGAVWRVAVWYRLCHSTRRILSLERQNDLCRHHLHVAHPSVHRGGQHPLTARWGCNK